MSKISDDHFFMHFLHFPKLYLDVSCYFRKLPLENSEDLFFPISNFSLSFRMPPYPGCLGLFFTFYTFTLTFRHLPMHFFRKLRRWMPPGWKPEAVAPPPTPLSTTLLPT